MSAYEKPYDWRHRRAYFIVSEAKFTSLPIRYSDYAEVFDMDEDELDELFNRVAMSMQVRVTVLPNDPTSH